MRGKGTGRIRSRRQKRKRRVRIRSDGHESLSSLRIQNPVLGGRIASAESSGVDRVLQDWNMGIHCPETESQSALGCPASDAVSLEHPSDQPWLARVVVRGADGVAEL